MSDPSQETLHLIFVPEVTTEQHTTLKQMPQVISDKQTVLQKNLEGGLEDIYKGLTK